MLPPIVAPVERSPGLVEVEATREMAFWCLLQAEMATDTERAGLLALLAEGLTHRLHDALP